MKFDTTAANAELAIEQAKAINRRVAELQSKCGTAEGLSIAEIESLPDLCEAILKLRPKAELVARHNPAEPGKVNLPSVVLVRYAGNGIQRVIDDLQHRYKVDIRSAFQGDMLAMKLGLGKLAAAARAEAQADLTKPGEWSVALPLSAIAGKLGCEARSRAVERRLITLGSDLRKRGRQSFQVRLDTLEEPYRSKLSR